MEPNSKTTSRSAPLVSVVTPVYNGADYLTQCMESILSQTYTNWEYIIVDNCSNDGSLEIANCFARCDPRIVVLSNPKHLKAIPNWNHSLRQISGRSRYCKIVHADDWLFPECLSKMVEAAETTPSVGLVSCYVLAGESVLNAEIPYPSHVVPGRDIARSLLLRKFKLYCTPSSQLIRSDSVRQRNALYDDSTGVLRAIDKQLCLELLKDSDFAFLHQVLTFTRVHSASLSLKVSEYGADYPEGLRLLQRFGPVYLSPVEFQTCWDVQVAEYSRFLGRSVFASRAKGFWRFHRDELRTLGCRTGILKLAGDAVAELIRILGEPLVHAEQRRRLVRERESVSPRSV
jgi:glycosyltransferase involved in cell wall biosynthesis